MPPHGPSPQQNQHLASEFRKKADKCHIDARYKHQDAQKAHHAAQNLIQQGNHLNGEIEQVKQAIRNCHSLQQMGRKGQLEHRLVGLRERRDGFYARANKAKQDVQMFRKSAQEFERQANVYRQNAQRALQGARNF